MSLLALIALAGDATPAAALADGLDVLAQSTGGEDLSLDAVPEVDDEAMAATAPPEASLQVRLASAVVFLLAQHAPALLVVAPLLAAPLAVVVRFRWAAFGVTLVAALFSLVCALVLVQATAGGLTYSYALGGWAPPVGIEYRVDAANAFVALIVALIGVVALPYGLRSVSREVDERHHGLFFAAYALLFCGLLGVTITGDAFNVFVFLEISSLATYTLVAMGARADKRALSAAYDYLILGTIGATFFVIGLGLLYSATGTLNMADLATKITAMEDNRTVRSAFAFIVIGMGLKAAIFPLHRWLPGSYCFAPSVISAFLAGTSTKVALYVIVRFMFSVHTAGEGFEQDTLEFLLLPLAVIAMFVTSLVACFQPNLKRMLAYSSVAQIGYMLLGTALLTVGGLTSTFVHMFNHAITKAALFMAAGIFVWQLGSAALSKLEGMGRAMPWTSAAFVLGGLSLIGVPGTAGFVSKWVLIQAALAKGWWVVAALVVLSSLVAIVYVWRVIEVLYLRPAPAEAAQARTPLALAVPTWTLVTLIVLFGFASESVVSISQTAAEGLLQGRFQAPGAIVIGIPGR